MKKYQIDYHTGAGNEYANTLEEAMEIADSGASYTGQDITISDSEGNEILRRIWWGVPYDEESPEENIIKFGQSGYYSDWVSE